MEFLTERCYTALNADELKPGSKVIVANYLESLRAQVEANSYPSYVVELSQIMGTSSTNRFKVNDKTFNLAYLVSEPEEKDWIVYICRPDWAESYLTSCRSDRWEIVQKEYDTKTKLFEGAEDECYKWYTSRRHLANVIAAWEDGKTIQYNSGNGWEDCCDNRPAWDITSQYRIKPECLKWTDLNIGDTITNGEETFMIIGIDTVGDYYCHILAGDNWIKDTELEDWEKVE